MNARESWLSDFYDSQELAQSEDYDDCDDSDLLMELYPEEDEDYFGSDEYWESDDDWEEKELESDDDWDEDNDGDVCDTALESDGYVGRPFPNRRPDLSGGQIGDPSWDTDNSNED